MRFSRLVATLIATAVTLPAFAEEAASPITGNFTIASEYIYRGIAQTNRKPAIQGGVDYAGPVGLYLGAWGSNISWLSDACGAGSACASGSPVSAPIELDFYGGIKFEAGPLAFDFGALKYYYPGTYPAGFVSPDTTELYGATSWKFVTFKYSYSLTNLFGATAAQVDGSIKKTEGSQYYDLSANPEVGGGVTLNLHYGRQYVANMPNASYNDWKVGATKAFGGWNLAVAYIDTTAKASSGDFYRSALNRDLGSARIVVSAGKTF